MRVRITLLPRRKNKYIFIHKSIHEFKDGAYSFTIYCDLIPWIFEKFNVTPGDNPYLQFDEFGLEYVNNLSVWRHNIKFTDIFPEMKVNLLDINDPVYKPYQNSQKLNCKSFIAFNHKELIFKLIGDFKYIYESLNICVHDMIYLRYHVYDKNKQCNLEMYFFIRKRTKFEISIG